MKKSLLLKFTIVLMIISTLSGCIWVEPIGFRRGGSHDSGGGGHDSGGGGHRGRH